ncbi:tetratricopeptide repeat protein [Candidatus Poribacteria bacterium]|nr:tetratricopeptide repeat protein [Candidatus Poribacteria bacterium]
MKRSSWFIIILSIVIFCFGYVILTSYAGEREKEEELKRDEQIERVKKRWDEDERSEEITPEFIYYRLMYELRRQQDEIHALREEIADLREMLKDRDDYRYYRRYEDRYSYRDRREEPEWESYRERWERERRDPEIHMEIRELELKLRKHPEDFELHTRLGDMYREIGKDEAAIEHYKAALEIKPGFDPPYIALKEMGYKFHKEEKEKDRPLEDSVGEVISRNEKGLKIENMEGEEIKFIVPAWQRDDGSWALSEDLSYMVKSLEPGTKVKIIWQKREGYRIIHRIEKVD